jgi:hypothetical protein
MTPQPEVVYLLIGLGFLSVGLFLAVFTGWINRRVLERKPDPARIRELEQQDPPGP